MLDSSAQWSLVALIVTGSASGCQRSAAPTPQAPGEPVAAEQSGDASEAVVDSVIDRVVATTGPVTLTDKRQALSTHSWEEYWALRVRLGKDAWPSEPPAAVAGQARDRLRYGFDMLASRPGNAAFAARRARGAGVLEPWLRSRPRGREFAKTWPVVGGEAGHTAAKRFRVRATPMFIVPHEIATRSPT